MVNSRASDYLAAQVMASVHLNGTTAAIDSGHGDSAAWLAEAGFATTAQAAEWPELDGLPTAGFQNVLCAGGLDQVGREDLIIAALV